MILFTPVGEGDQYMTYLKGSHRCVHSRFRTIENSRFLESEVAAMSHLERMKCTGPAGSVFLFDSNGLHRGNRSHGAVRDSMIPCYNAGRSIWPLTVTPEALSPLSPRQRAFLQKNPRVRVKPAAAPLTEMD
jgi:hypothetical protein